MWISIICPGEAIGEHSTVKASLNCQAKTATFPRENTNAGMLE